MINGAFWLLLPLCLSGLLWRDRGLGRAWLWAGLAGLLLLSPTLLRSGTIPSPAGSLASLPPWQATGDAASGNPEMRDVTFQVQPWLIYLRHELRAGRPPFWNPHHYAGMPFWSNGSAAPLFPLHLLFAALPLGLGFVVLPFARIVLGGCGAFCLARRLGASEQGALLPAIAYPLSGMLVSYALFPMGNALALVPWVLWAVEGLASARGSWRALAVTGGLQLLAGHPETCLHTALLCGVYLLGRGASGRAWAGLIGGWTAASALAAVQIVPLASTLFDSSRWQHAAEVGSLNFSEVAPQLLRWVWPSPWGMPSQHDYWGVFPWVASAAYVGIVSLVLAVAGIASARHQAPWRGLVALGGVALAGAYQLPVASELLGALPLVGQAPPHRLIFGVELTLAVLAAAGYDRWLGGRQRGTLAGGSLLLLLIASGGWHLGRQWHARGELVEQALWAVGALLIAGLLAWASRGGLVFRQRLAALLPLLLAADLALAHHQANSTLELDRLYPPTAAISFLQEQDGRVAGLGPALHANAAMVYDLYDPRGDESIKMERYERYYAALARPEPIYSLPISQWRQPRLDDLGLKWVLGGPHQPAPDQSWQLTYQGEDGRVWQRPTALPLVRWQGSAATAGLHIETRQPGHWKLAWQSAEQRTLVVAECWDRGWRARIDGRAVSLGLEDDVFLAVEVGPGKGHLELIYRPHGIGLGLLLSGLGLVSLWVWRRQPPC